MHAHVVMLDYYSLGTKYTQNVAIAYDICLTNTAFPFDMVSIKQDVHIFYIMFMSMR